HTLSSKSCRQSIEPLNLGGQGHLASLTFGHWPFAAGATRYYRHAAVVPAHELCEVPLGFGLRQSSGALGQTATFRKAAEGFRTRLQVGSGSLGTQDLPGNLSPRRRSGESAKGEGSQQEARTQLILPSLRLSPRSSLTEREKTCFDVCVNLRRKLPCLVALLG